MVSSPTRGWLRLARASIVTVAAVVLAAGAHIVGGGVLPGVAQCGWLALGTFFVCWVGTSRRLGRAAITGLLVALQVGLHLGLMAMASPTPMPMHSSGNIGLGALGISWPMVLAHVAATVLTTIVLARGEQAVWFVTQLVRWFLPVLACDLPAGYTAPASAVRVFRERGSGYASGGLGRRGPPVATS